LWLEWWAGRQVDQSDLWGWKVLYWARAGKVLQFLAGLTIVLDIVGPTRLRTAGQRLAPTRAKFYYYLALLASKHVWIALTVALAVSVTAMLAIVHFVEEDNPVKELIPAWAKGAITAWIIISFLAALIFRLGDKRKQLPSAGASIAVGLSLAPAIVFFVVLITLILLPLLTVLYLLVLAMRMMASLLDRDSPGHAFRSIAAALFIVGFHFDLLAS
jgi:hypothetical protein